MGHALGVYGGQWIAKFMVSSHDDHIWCDANMIAYTDKAGAIIHGAITYDRGVSLQGAMIAKNDISLNGCSFSHRAIFADFNCPATGMYFCSRMDQGCCAYLNIAMAHSKPSTQPEHDSLLERLLQHNAGSVIKKIPEAHGWYRWNIVMITQQWLRII
jgi:hypothetical protein